MMKQKNGVMTDYANRRRLRNRHRHLCNEIVKYIMLGAKYLLTLTSYFIKYGTVIIISERGFLS